MVAVGNLPPVGYAAVDDEVVAYRDLGGPGVALVYLGTNGSHQDLMWDEPGSAHFLHQLASLGRLITLDRRGSGLSSRGAPPTIEARVADVRAVLDATRVDDAVILGASGSTLTALAFAASHPHRCRALVLYAASARSSWAPDYPIGVPRDQTEQAIDACATTWGSGITALLYAPSLAGDEQFLDWAARHERAIATPLDACQWLEMYAETDVSDVLAHVHAPALVAIPAKAPTFVPGWARYVAERLPDARSVELDATDEWPFGDGMADFLDALEGFLHEVVEIDLVVSDANRRLATVLFTDIVDSTERLHEMGDRRWRSILESHDDLARRVVGRHGGYVVKSTGDGTLALFDGPAGAVAAAFGLLAGLDRLGLPARAGVHVGEVEERGEDIAGIAVHLASRVADLAAAGEVLVTTTVRDLVAGSGLGFEDRGSHRLKGMDQDTHVLAACPSAPD